MKYSIYRRLFAFVLAVSMLLPMATNAITTSAEDAQTEKAATSESVSVQLPDVVSVAELTQGTQILQHIDEEVLAANSHILRLPAEEELSSYAFLNRDGSMTVYYLDKAVKYIDQSGEIVEKDLTLTKTLGGFTTASSDIGLVLPDDPANGINMSYEGHNITLAPMGGTLRNAAQNDGESVVYPNYYGGGMSLKYTPSLDGLKEDIVLSRYSGVNSFTFRLFTDGLRMYQADGRYYLAKTSNSAVQISLGDVVAFDAKGKFSMGTMTVETVTMGQEYLLTLSVDPAFLTSLTTSYPVCIDPTLQVSDNTHGAGAIEDLTVYSGVPTLNADWPYLHCGYYDSTYRVARTLFRLPGLLNDATYQSISADDITSVTFHIKEATGSAGIPVYLHANTGNANWTESGSNWNNAGYVVGTRYATASPGLEQFAGYDITNLVKAWKTTAESPQAGFIMVSSNEVSVDKAFYGSETATTSRRPYVVVNYNVGTNFDNAIALSLNQTVPVSITASGEKRYFSYTPINTGFYTFASSDIIGDSRIWLYNPSRAELTNEYHSTDDVQLTYHLIAYKTYYVAAGCFSDSQGNYGLTATYSALAIPPEADMVTTFYAGYAEIDTAYEFKYYKFVPEVTGNYIFQSYNHTGDPYIELYTSSLMPRGFNDDGGADGNFRLYVTLEAGQTYYIAAGQTGNNIGHYHFSVFMPVDMQPLDPQGDVNHLRNVVTGLYLDIHGPDEQQFAHQWSLHKGLQERWRFYQQMDGTYTIQSQFGDKYYLGISSGDVNSNNVVLLPEATSYAEWNFYAIAADGSLILEPVMAPGRVLCVQNYLQGTELQLCWMNNAAPYNRIWRIESHGHATLEAQQDPDWCWAASARMLVGAYNSVGEDYTQENAVNLYASYGEGGTNNRAAMAAAYYQNGSSSDYHKYYLFSDTCILTENGLRKVLDCGDTIYISIAHYMNFKESGGHAVVAAGYTTEVVDGELKYRFIIYDPWPEDAFDSSGEYLRTWLEDYMPTTGQELKWSYSQLCAQEKEAVTELGQVVEFTAAWDGYVIAAAAMENIDPHEDEADLPIRNE